MIGTTLELGLSLAGGEVGLEMVGGAGAGDTGLGGLQRVGRSGAGAGAGAAGGGAEPVRLFLPLALRRIAAACSIQVRGREEICDEYRIFDLTARARSRGCFAPTASGGDSRPRSAPCSCTCGTAKEP